MMKAFYGFSPDLPPFANKTPQAQAAILHRWGATAIFGGYENPSFVDAVHAQGMQIYAEFPCFVGKEWWEKLPESRPITVDGQPLAPIDWYHGVNPAVPSVRQQRLTALSLLLRTYAIDGVWLDFIRWPCHWEKPAPLLQQTSFDQTTVARFSADLGLDLGGQDAIAAANTILSRYTNEWATWRCEQITTWVAEARQLVDALRPGLQLGLFGIPWRQQDFNGAIRTIIGQEYAALASYIDIFSPMTYHRMCGQPVSWISEVVQEISQLTQRPICPIIQSVDHPTPLAAAEYAMALTTALTTPKSAGVIIFTLAGMLTAEKQPITEQILRI